MTSRMYRNPLVLFRPYKGRLMGLLALLLTAAFAEAVGLVILSALLNLFTGAAGTSQPSWLASMFAYVGGSPTVFLVALCLTYVGKSLLALWANYASFALGLRMTDDWRNRLVRAYLHAPLHRLDKKQGEMLQLVLDEPTVIGLGLGASGMLAQNAFSTLTVYIVLLYLSPLVALGLTIMALVAMVAIGFLSRYSRKIAARRSGVFSEGYAYITEMLSAIKQLRVFGLEAEAEARVAANLGRMRELQLKANVVASSPRLMIEVVFLCGLAAMLIALMPKMGETAVLSTLGLAVAAALRVLPTFSASAGTWVLVQQSWPAMEKMAGELAKVESAVVQETVVSGQRQVSCCDRILVQNLHFSYPGREQVLAGVDLEIPCGSFTAIVGPTGSGKSTLIDLLCGFYAPSEGCISVDDVDLRGMSISDWRRQLGVVSQDGFLLSGTIRENLCLLRPDCPEDLLRHTVAMVGADTLIRDLPCGYDTRIGERGLTISGGERQRLALARVLVKEPRVLILDEATSALDVESEEALQDSLERFRGRMTMIVIAHRLSTVRRADRIYVLDSGKVAESGRHDDLVQRGGLYAAMQRTGGKGIAR